MDQPGQYPGPGDPADPKRIGSATLTVSAAEPLPASIALYVSPYVSPGGRAVALAPAGARCEEPNLYEGGLGMTMTVTSAAGTVTFERPTLGFVDRGFVATICAVDPDGRPKLEAIGWDVIDERSAQESGVQGAEGKAECGAPEPSSRLPGGAFGTARPGESGATTFAAVSPWNWQKAGISLQRYTCALEAGLEAICRLGQQVAFDPGIAISVSAMAALRPCWVEDGASLSGPAYRTALPAALPADLKAVAYPQVIFGVDQSSGFWTTPGDWDCRYEIGANGSSALTLSRSVPENEGVPENASDRGFPSIVISSSGGGSLGSAYDIACPWFPKAGSLYDPPMTCAPVPKGFKVEPLSLTLVRYRGPSTDPRAPNGSIVAGLVLFEPGRLPWANAVQCEAPSDELDLCAALALDGQPVLAP